MNDYYEQTRKFAEAQAEIYSKDMFGDIDTTGVNKIFVDGFMAFATILNEQQLPAKRQTFQEKLDDHIDNLKKNMP